MKLWEDLEHELDRWHQNGLSATFWWRDDDAIDVTDSSDRLIGISKDYGISLGLAVIPRFSTARLRKRLRTEASIHVLQHGYDHSNHTPPGYAKAEFGFWRDLEAQIGELRRGLFILRDFEGFLPVLVPPWDMIDSRLMPMLPGIGIKYISGIGLKQNSANAQENIATINAHFDVVDWKKGGAASEGVILTTILWYLYARREGKIASDEATGILTHHLVHDEETWASITKLLAFLTRHPAVSWVSPATLFHTGARKD